MPLHDILRRLRAPGSQWADLYEETLTSTVVSMDDGRVERVVTGSERGVGLRVVAGFRTFLGHTNVLDPGRLGALADELARQARNTGGPAFILPGEQAPPAAPAAPAADESLDVPRRISLVRLADRVARAHYPAVRQVQVTLAERRQELLILAPGREAAGDRRDTVMAVQVVAAEGNRLERGYETLGGSTGSGFLDEAAVEELARLAAARAVLMLGAGPAPAGTMPVVLSAEAGGTMVHEAIGHGLENDLAGQGFSVYSNRIGEMVASPLISVIDDPTLPGRRGSYLFDDEGTFSRRNVLVDRGRLTGFISDLLSAARFGGAATGNGRRQSFRHAPIPRMSNTLILPGTSDPAAIIRETRTGLLVRRMGGGQVNTVNGDFVFEVAEGYLLVDGEVGPPVRGALLTGNGPAILRDIDAVGSDLGFAIGTCGKEGQGVPVADAQPTLRIPAIVVGGRVGS